MNWDVALHSDNRMNKIFVDLPGYIRMQGCTSERIGNEKGKRETKKYKGENECINFNAGPRWSA